MNLTYPTIIMDNNIIFTILFIPYKYLVYLNAVVVITVFPAYIVIVFAIFYKTFPQLSALIVQWYIVRPIPILY